MGGGADIATTRQITRARHAVHTEFIASPACMLRNKYLRPPPPSDVEIVKASMFDWLLRFHPGACSALHRRGQLFEGSPAGHHPRRCNCSRVCSCMCEDVVWQIKQQNETSLSLSHTQRQAHAHTHARTHACTAWMA